MEYEYLNKISKKVMVSGKVFLILIVGLILPTHSWGVTRYVAKTGNDNNNSLSWTTAWATTSKVQSTLAGGDTVYFGTGTWRDVHLRPPKGSASDRTCYACSSFVQGIAHLWGSQQLTTWIVHSGNVWKARYVGGSNCWSSQIYTLAQHDSLLKWGDAIPTSAGNFYHNLGKDTIYAWCYGNANPNSCDMEGSCHEVFDFADDNAGYTTVWGFDLRYGCQGVIIFNGDGTSTADSCLIAHCNISGVSIVTAENPSAVISRKCDNEYTPSAWGKDNEVRACTLSNFCDWYQYNHGDGACIYTQTRFVIDSCYIDGRGRGNVGIIFKFGTQGCVARFNTIKNINTNATRVAYSGQADSFYGNIIIGNGTSPDDGANLTENPESSPWYSNSCVWLNNTFYDCNYLTGLWTGYEDDGGTGHKFKYNVQYKPTSSYYLGYFEADTKARWTIDSNLIYRPSFGSGSFYYNEDVAFSTWKSTEGFDTHSDTVYSHVGFNNPASGDFSRPSSSPEMDMYYGGKHWTRYGAWQPKISGENHCPTSPTLNLPADGDTILGARPILSLNNAVDTDGNILVYDFQVYSDSQLTSLVVGGVNILQGANITSWQVTQNLPDENWYWWRARSFDGICHSDWSNKRKFYVKAGQLYNGDLNNDGMITVGDVIYLIGYLFKGGPSPQPVENGDINGDCKINVADVIYLINYLFKGGPAPQPGCAN